MSYVERGSFHLVPAETERKEFPSAIMDLVQELYDGPREAEEVADTLGCSLSALRKRIFRARGYGYPIVLRNGRYSLESDKRVCDNCGKVLSRYNLSRYCFNHQNPC